MLARFNGRKLGGSQDTTALSVGLHDGGDLNVVSGTQWEQPEVSRHPGADHHYPELGHQQALLFIDKLSSEKFNDKLISWSTVPRPTVRSPP